MLLTKFVKLQSKHTTKLKSTPLDAHFFFSLRLLTLVSFRALSICTRKQCSGKRNHPLQAHQLLTVSRILERGITYSPGISLTTQDLIYLYLVYAS